MTELEKFRVLLPHLIEHNHEHTKELLKWAKALDEAGNPDAASAVRKAFLSAEEVTRQLKTALDLAGGPVSGHEKARHHHEH
ncbi:MAG: hypothetical protein M0022_01295 [Desulfobacteraceae bacterium]|nr:hypothetical protein [Desulfobacteraceae bacterium]